MSRILFWIILFGAGYWFWRRAKSAALRAAHTGTGPVPGKRTGGRGPDNGSGGFGRRRQAAPAQLAEPMVRCAYCGAHSPRSETVSQLQHDFCSQDHARRFASGERMTDKP